MVIRPLSLVLKCSLLIVSAGFLFSCSEPAGGAGRPDRKKMFTLNDQELTGECNFARPAHELQQTSFGMHDVDLTVNGIRGTYVSLAMPDASCDSAAIAMALTCKPFAVTLLSQWAKQEKKGVLFDLRHNYNNDELRSDYVVESPGMRSVPVTFLYDRYSANRVAGYINTIKLVPALQCKLLESSQGEWHNF